MVCQGYLVTVSGNFGLVIISKPELDQETSLSPDQN
jgi:hypothetical protein